MYCTLFLKFNDFKNTIKQNEKLRHLKKRHAILDKERSEPQHKLATQEMCVSDQLKLNQLLLIAVIAQSRRRHVANKKIKTK